MTSPKKNKGPAVGPLCRLCETRHWSNQPHKFGPKDKKKDKRDRDD